jgi:uncharacterized protein YndB with AHSA1/START domain
MSQIQGAVVEQVVELDIHIEAPPEAVFEFLVDPEKLLRWMGEKADIDPRPGGRFWLDLGQGTAEGEYLEVVPPERVVLTWGWVGSDTVPPGSSTLRIELSPVDGGTELRLRHSGLPGDECDKHLEGWLYFGGRLHVVAEGGDPDADRGTDPVATT